MVNFLVSLTKPRKAHGAGKTLLLDEFVRLFLEEINISISRLRKEHSLSPRQGVSFTS